MVQKGEGLRQRRPVIGVGDGLRSSDHGHAAFWLHRLRQDLFESPLTNEWSYGDPGEGGSIFRWQNAREPVERTCPCRPEMLYRQNAMRKMRPG